MENMEMAKNVDKCGRVSTNGDEGRKMSTNVDKCRQTATNVDKCRQMPKNVERVTVRLPRTAAGQEDVFVSVNNRNYIVARGVAVEVPAFVAEVLSHREEMLETILRFQARKAKA